MQSFLNNDDKKRIYDVLADCFIVGLKNNYIGSFEQKHIAKTILKEVEQAKSIDEVIIFLETLSKKYSFFNTALITLKSDLIKKKEEIIINKLEQYIKKIN
jgi:hypothetical protein